MRKLYLEKVLIQDSPAVSPDQDIILVINNPDQDQDITLVTKNLDPDRAITLVINNQEVEVAGIMLVIRTSSQDPDPAITLVMRTNNSIPRYQILSPMTRSPTVGTPGSTQGETTA